MKNVGVCLVYVACGFAVTGGCGESAPPVEQKPKSFSDFSAPATTTETPITAPAPPPPATEQVKAEAGVGVKGQGYGGGIITEPVHQYFHVQDRLTFEAMLPKAMDLYRAGNNNKGPKTHEAFMKEIIEANSIDLPELPDGHRYLYDPKTEMLMVERPAGPNQTGN
jgi:hypothetical protein